MIKIYTDGSCLGNPGNGGWAAIIKIKDPMEYLDKLNFHRKLNSFKDYS